MHLVLTVGKNPLPVALAGLYFRKEVTGITLVHSSESADECKRIEDFWHQRELSVTQCIKISAEPDQHFNTQQLARLPATDIHFHYSGGTTAMAIAVIKSRPDAETSYFSLLSNRIAQDQGRASEDLRRQPDLSINVEDLSELHGFPIVKTFGSQAVPLMTGRLIHLAERADDIQAKLTCARPNYYHLYDCDKDPVDFLTSDDRTAHDINDGLGQSAFRRCSDGSWHASISPSLPEFWDICMLMRADRAFECKVHLALRRAFERVLGVVPPIVQSVHFARTPTVHDSKETFEADLLTTLGYQLLYVSCTMSKEAKEKAFEAFHRSRQIGGTGARTIVIAGLQDADKKGQDEQLLRLEIGLSKDDHLLRIQRVDPKKLELDGLTDWFENHLKQIWKQRTLAWHA